MSSTDQMPRTFSKVKTRFYLIISLFVAIGFCILSLDAMRTYVIDGARAYVGAEGSYSKGQKDAIFHLIRYAYTHDPELYEKFHESLTAPIGDRDARLALQSDPPNRQAAREGFLAARTHPDDIDKMISLFLYFGEVQEMEEAIEIWTEADKRIAILIQLGDELRDEVEEGDPDPKVIARILAEVEQQNIILTEFEDRFSAVLGAAARRVDVVTGAVTIGVAIVLLFVGTLMSLSITRGIRETQKELVDSEARFRRIVDSNIIGIVFWDADGRVLDANDAFLSSLGYDQSDLPGMDWREVTRPESWAADEAALEQVLETGVCTPYEKQFIRKDGGTAWTILGAAIIDREASSGVAFVLDVSIQHALEEQLNHSQKMEAIGTLVGGIAHDFNNTLTAMYGNIALAAAANKDDQVDGYLKTMDRLSQHSAKIVGQLMSFARKDMVQMKPLVLNTLLLEFKEFARTAIPESIEFDVVTCDESITILGDQTQLHQVLLNLVANSRDALFQTTNPKIECELDKTLVGGLPFASLCIKDNGTGMSPQAVERVFEPFYTTKGVGEGTGLGMAMVYGAVARHEGKISVDSVEGKGTQINILFPLVDDTLSSQAPHEQSYTLASDREFVIMIVDDDSVVRSTCASYLQNAGFKTVEASNGVHALAQLAESVKIDLVVTDVVMPKIGGVKLVEEIRSQYPGLPIILMTGYNPDQAGVDGDLKASDIVILMKPFPYESLVQHAHRLLG